MPDVNTCTCDCHSSFTGWTCTGKSAYFINGNVWCQPRNWQWGPVKNETLRERDDLNFPCICRNIPVASAYEVYISQLIQYSRACDSYQDFLDRWLLLTRKLLSQGLSWSHHLESFTLATMTLVTVMSIRVTNDHEYVPLVENNFQSFPHSWLIIEFVIRLTRQVPLVEQYMFTLPEHLSSSSV
jgi:hypothetical protein